MSRCACQVQIITGNATWTLWSSLQKLSPIMQRSRLVSYVLRITGWHNRETLWYGEDLVHHVFPQIHGSLPHRTQKEV